MSRFVHLAVSYATAVGYLLVVTWGSAWHDHHHENCCPTHECTAEYSSAVEDTHAHSYCCSDQHAFCCVEPQTADFRSSGDLPRPAPCHDDDCVVCQTLAHLPLKTPTITLVDASEPVPDWVMVAGPDAVISLPTAYDSRGPPLV